MAHTNRVSEEQLETLLEFIVEHPAIVKGISLGTRSRETLDKLWKELTIKLNGFNNGSSKTSERWKKYWADIKHKSKSRLARRRRDALDTGDGLSSQDDLSETDKKVLAIIGEERAVFGDSVHRVPVSSAEPQIPVQSESLIVLQETLLPGNVAEGNVPVTISSPSTRGQTCRVYTLEVPPSLDTSSAHIEMPTQSIPEPPLTGIESPASRPPDDRPRLRRNNPTIQSRIDPRWVMEVERSRVEAEKKLADAAYLMAESSRAQVEVARAQVETTRALVELVRQQSDDIRALVELSREQASRLSARDP